MMEFVIGFWEFIRENWFFCLVAFSVVIALTSSSVNLIRAEHDLLVKLGVSNVESETIKTAYRCVTFYLTIMIQIMKIGLIFAIWIAFDKQVYPVLLIGVFSFVGAYIEKNDTGKMNREIQNQTSLD